MAVSCQRPVAGGHLGARSARQHQDGPHRDDGGEQASGPHEHSLAESGALHCVPYQSGRAGSRRDPGSRVVRLSTLLSGAPASSSSSTDTLSATSRAGCSTSSACCCRADQRRHVDQADPQPLRHGGRCALLEAWRARKVRRSVHIAATRGGRYGMTTPQRCGLELRSPDLNPPARLTPVVPTLPGPTLPGRRAGCRPTAWRASCTRGRGPDATPSSQGRARGGPAHTVERAGAATRERRYCADVAAERGDRASQLRGLPVATSMRFLHI